MRPSAQVWGLVEAATRRSSHTTAPTIDPRFVRECPGSKKLLFAFYPLFLAPLTHFSPFFFFCFRSCSCILPRAHFPLCRSLAQKRNEKKDDKIAKKARVAAEQDVDDVVDGDNDVELAAAMAAIMEGDAEGDEGDMSALARLMSGAYDEDEDEEDGEFMPTGEESSEGEVDDEEANDA